MTRSACSSITVTGAETLLGPLLGVARRVAVARRAALGKPGTWVSLDDVVTRSVAHVHLHVVPGPPGDGARGLSWPGGRYADPDEAAGIAGSIREQLR